MVVKVVVHGPRGETMDINLCDTEEQFKSITVLQLREKIKERLGYQDLPEDIRLFFRDKSLDQDSSRLSAYGIQDKSFIFVVVKIPGGSVIVKVVVHGLRGETMDINLCDTEEQFKSITVLQLREKIAERLGYQDLPEDIRLFFLDKHLDEDSSLLSAYGIKHMSVIHVIERLRGGGLGILDPGKGDSGMGDKGGKNRSKEKLLSF